MVVKKEQRNFHHINELKYKFARKIAFFSSLSCAHLSLTPENHTTTIHYLALLHSFFKLLVYDDNKDGVEGVGGLRRGARKFFAATQVLRISCTLSFCLFINAEKPLKLLGKMLKRLKNYSFLNLDYVTTRKSKKSELSAAHHAMTESTTLRGRKNDLIPSSSTPAQGEAEEIDTMFLSE